MLNKRTQRNSKSHHIFESDRFISYKEMKRFYTLYLNNEINVSKSLKKHVTSLNDLNQYRLQHNEQCVHRLLSKEETYLNGILHSVDPNINLDIKQRHVVLRDEDYTLVVAGAGSGKTTTIAAKVKYLTEKQGVDPKKILIISYTNEAVNELKERIQEHLKIPAVITTFHKTGYTILKKHKELEKTQVIREGLMYNIIRDYLTQTFRQNPDSLKRLIWFFGYYIDDSAHDAPFEHFIIHQRKTDFTSLKENLKIINDDLINQKAKRKQTIRQEVMRSVEEVQIANFLYLNQVDYEYEAPYPFTFEHSDRLYTPDFTLTVNGEKIYLEHFGITQEGHHSRYRDDELKRYKETINDKVLFHKKHQTTLLYTFSQYTDGRPFLEHLKAKLEAAGIVLKERPLEDVYDQLMKESSNRYIHRFIFLVLDFIRNFKINGFNEADFLRMKNTTRNVRTHMFLQLVQPIYYHYQTYKEKHHLVDFSDMINHSASLLSDPKNKHLIPDFEYVIVDEYQDISQQRFDLTQALAKITDAKIVAVGDDWQSIYAFAGSRIDLFLKFKKLMGYADYLEIDYTYRNAQEVIDIAGSFIQKNSAQLTKQLKSPKTISEPIQIYGYSDLTYKNEIKGRKGIVHEQAKVCQEIIGKIVHERPNAKILILVRYNFEIHRLGDSEFFELKESNGHLSLKAVNFPQADLTVLTVHRSKGLGFDDVILTNGSDELFGFPSQIEMDPLLKLVKFDDRTYEYAEERRLFYVALTRTKNRAYILYPHSKPSDFVKELAKEYALVVNHGQAIEDIPLHEKHEKRCPHCGYPLQFKSSKAYQGLRLFICTNEPEVCSYMTNNLRSNLSSIKKCAHCATGFLIVKHSRNLDSYFFGCTNYQTNGKGCNHTETLSD